MKEQIARALKHGGVAITVTSLTDVTAFAIGSSTVGSELFYSNNSNQSHACISYCILTKTIIVK